MTGPRSRPRAALLNGCGGVLRTQLVLTDAEHRVLHLLPTHLTTTQIAAALNVTRHTVRSQVRSIYQKMDVQTRHAAVLRFLQSVDR